MKSFLLALTFSIALVSASFLFTNKMDSIAQVLSEKTYAVYTSLQEDDIDGAKRRLEKAIDEFKKKQVLLEATGNHEELMRIELAYAQAKEFINKGQIGDAMASLREIDILIEHIPGNFEIKPENIL